MKTSGKLIFILVGFFALVIVISAILVRTSIGKVVAFDKKSAETGDVDKTRIEKDYDFADFSSVDVKGMWVADIAEGEEYSVQVSAPAYIYPKLNVREQSGTLYLDMEILRTVGFSDNEVRVKITCPSLDSIAAAGTSTITVRDFDSPDLNVELEGALSMDGSQNRIGNLDMRAEGTIQFDFKESLTDNAHLRMDGAGNVKITMNGGVLDGEINGFGRVEYYGEARSEDIRNNGFATVKKR